MEAHKKAIAALVEHNRIRIASGPMLPPDAGETAPNASPKLSNASPFTENAKRTIPNDFSFDPRSLKPLVQTLWAMSVALGHALTAHRQFARIKSSTISPDGMLGGRGYIMGIKDVRQRLYESCESLSAIVDTIHDEVNAPHWKPKLGELEKSEVEDLKRLLSDAEDNLEDPEGEVEEEMEAVEHGKPQSWKPGGSDRFEKGDGGSKLPDGGDQDTFPRGGPHPAGAKHPGNRPPKQASVCNYDRRTDLERTLDFWRKGSIEVSDILEMLNMDPDLVRANSSVNPDTLEGPRIKHLDRADDDQHGPFGSVNHEPPSMHDPWSRNQGVGHEYDYSPNRSAESGIPDANSDRTPTEGYDFGIGRGNGNDAHGQGAGGYGATHPSTGGYGVYGPASGLPDDPGGRTRDPESDSNPRIEVEIGGGSSGLAHASVLPNDDEDPVARSDYYPGPRGNDVSSGSGLPGDGASPSYDSELDMAPNKGYRHEQSAPYTLWDDSTHQQRPDYTYMRPPIQGPYTKE